MDFWSVIMLGHTREQPLIRPSSELVDGIEPHGIKQSGNQQCGDSTHEHGVPAGGEQVYPGWCSWVGTWEEYTGY